MQVDWIVGSIFTVFFTELLACFELAVRLFWMLYMLFLLVKINVSMKKVNVIFTPVALHSIALCVFVFLCFLSSYCASSMGFSTQKTHIHHNISVIHIFPNTVKHELAENGPFNTNKYLRMTNQVLESWVIHFNESNHIKSCLAAESLYMVK